MSEAHKDAEREALDELRNIANAKRFDRETFADDTEFADWAQNRARHTLARAASPQASGQTEREVLEIPDECAASGASCSYGPHGRHGEMQCQYCGKPRAAAPQGLTDERIRDIALRFDHGSAMEWCFSGASIVDFARALLAASGGSDGN